MKTKFKWYGREVSDEIREKAGRATWKFAEAILGNANNNIPHNNGTLERSGIVTQGNLSGNPNQIFNQAEAGQWPKVNYSFDFKKEPAFFISYNTPYAIKQHEDTTLHHSEGEAKWLENMAKSMSGKLEGYVAKEMK